MFYLSTLINFLLTLACVPGMLTGEPVTVIVGLICAACTGFVANFAFVRN